MRLIILILVALFLWACNDSNQKPEQQATENTEAATPSSDPIVQRVINRTNVPKVSIKEAIRLHEKEGYRFVDLRTPKEIADGKIEDALEIDVKSYDWLTGVKKLDPNDKLILYCQAGTRSALAAKLFSELEFHYVVDMTDGYSGWKKYHNIK